MAGFPFAAFYAHEFVEFEHASLAACPAFGALVEYGLAWVVDAFLALSRRWGSGGRCVVTCSAAAGGLWRDGECGIVGVGLGSGGR